MSRTTFSGPVASDNGFIFVQTTTSDIADITSDVNTKDKQPFVTRYMANGVMFTPIGSAPSDAWFGSDSSAINPA